jgi:uncharacterized membrane protein YeaQ/YmgE (transglycosylase-associated protein family)
MISAERIPGSRNGVASGANGGETMNFVWMIIVGLVVGALARWLMPGAQPMGWIMTALLGIAGSFVGGLLSGVLSKSSDGKFGPAGLVLSVIGAMLLLWLAPKIL